MDSLYVQKELCRKTTYTNENNQLIEIDYDDLISFEEIGSGQYGIFSKCVNKKSNLVMAAKVTIWRIK
jgi:hypothetical protein